MQKNSDWIVLKFGGTSVSQKHRWNTVARLINQRADMESARVLVVVSALSGVTNSLQAMCERHSDREFLSQQCAALVERHVSFCADLGLDASEVISKRIEVLQTLCQRAASQGSVDFSWQAELLAQGELLSSTIGAAYLRSLGVDLGWFDSRDWLRAVDLPNASAWANRLSVNCSLQTDPEFDQRLKGFAPTHAIAQGFIARADDGGTAILGRGGSDTSAAYFGALFKARRVEIWTDVPGMFSANPRQVPDARLLTRLDYEEAQEIATTGAKVLHPRCIHPCREARVPIWIKDTERPDLPGTVIADGAKPVPGVKAISARRGIVLVSMESIGMWQQVGFLSDVFAMFKLHGLSVDLIGSAETNVTVSLDPSENLVNSDVLDTLCADLASICRVKVIAPCASVTMVGRGMRSRLHRLSEILAEFGREQVHLISQSSNDLNLTFVVDERLVDGALMPHLHSLLISSAAMPIDESEVFGPSWKQIDAPKTERKAWWMSRTDELKALAGKGTPRYVYALDIVRERARALNDLAMVDRRFYAIKANSHPQVLKCLLEMGFGLECVSQAELVHVLAHFPDLDPDRILFTPSFAPRAEYEFAFANRVHVTIDNPNIVDEWADLFAKQKINLRLDPGFGHGHHDKVKTGGKEAKFGLALEDVPKMLRAVSNCGAAITGLHAHIGSGIFEAEHWAAVYAQLARVADTIGTVEFLDVGGGIGIPYDPESDVFDMNRYGAVLAEMKSVYPQYQLWIEPGRYLVAEAGVLLTRVTQCAAKHGVRRVGLDAGMNAILRPALYGAFHEISNLDRIADAPGELCEVVGPICETGDVLGRRRRLPDSTVSGDVVLIANAGAYGRVMSNQYNLRALPDEEVIDV